METRKRIVESALKVFSEKGFLGATTKEIAREADVAEITLFRHFSSKEKLFEEVINTYSILPDIKGLIAEVSKLPYEEALRIIAKRYLNSLSVRIDLIRLMHQEVQRYPDKICEIYHSFVDEVYRALALYFAEMQKTGILRKFNPELGSRAFLGLLFSHFNAQEFLLGEEYRMLDTDMVIREFVSIFVRGTAKTAKKDESVRSADYEAGVGCSSQPTTCN